MICIKDGVDFSLLQPKLVTAIVTAARYFDQLDAACVITSGRDGKHMNGSLHPTGYAADLRTRNMSTAQQERLRDDLQDELGQDYDRVIESDHLHIEYDPPAPGT